MLHAAEQLALLALELLVVLVPVEVVQHELDLLVLCVVL